MKKSSVDTFCSRPRFVASLLVTSFLFSSAGAWSSFSFDDLLPMDAQELATQGEKLIPNVGKRVDVSSQECVIAEDLDGMYASRDEEGKTRFYHIKTDEEIFFETEEEFAEKSCILGINHWPSDKRTTVQNVRHYPYNTVLRLQVHCPEDVTRSTFSGTATMIGPRCALTAAHVVFPYVRDAGSCIKAERIKAFCFSNRVKGKGQDGRKDQIKADSSFSVSGYAFPKGGWDKDGGSNRSALGDYALLLFDKDLGKETGYIAPVSVEVLENAGVDASFLESESDDRTQILQECVRSTVLSGYPLNVGGSVIGENPSSFLGFESLGIQVEHKGSARGFAFWKKKETLHYNLHTSHGQSGASLLLDLGENSGPDSNLYYSLSAHSGGNLGTNIGAILSSDVVKNLRIWASCLDKIEKGSYDLHGACVVKM